MLQIVSCSLIGCIQALWNAITHHITLRACLHGGAGPQVGKVTRLGGVTRLYIKCLILKLKFGHVYMIGGVTRRLLPHPPGVPHLRVNRP